MPKSGIFGTPYIPYIHPNYPLYKTTKSSAAKKSSSAAANAGDTEGKYVSGQINIFTGKPLPKISELPPVGVITKPSLPLTNKYTDPLTSGKRPVPSTSVPRPYSIKGGSRSRRTVRRKHKSHRNPKRVRHTRRKQTRRHRHRR
jgi:hypothetical protein